MAEIVGWLLALALLLILVLCRRSVHRQQEQALVNNLVAEANSSLDLSMTLHTALDRVLTFLEMDCGAVHLYDTRSGKMTLFVQKGMADELQLGLQVIPPESAPGFLPDLIREKKAVFLEDINKDNPSTLTGVLKVHGLVSVACVPLYTRENLVATLLVCNQKKIRFRKKQVNFLIHTSQALGLTVANAQLYQQVSEKKRQLTVINEITKIINTNLNLKKINERFAVKFKELIHCDLCLIMLPARGDKARVFLLSTPHKTRLTRNETFPLKNTSLNWAIRHKQPQFEGDLSRGKFFSEDEILVNEGIRSVVRLPIRSNSEVTGVFILGSRLPSYYAEADLDLLRLVVEQLALTLENYFLFKKITALSLTDELTGLGNRRMLRHEMIREIRRAKRYGRELALLMLDVDNFKEVNDQYGHMACDRVLKQLAKVIRNNVRDIDNCFRFGGEEFLVLLPETGLQGATSTAEKIRAILESTVFNNCGIAITPRITVSIGIAVYPLHAKTAQELLQRADQALYRAKAGGRNCSYLYDEGMIQIPSLINV